MSMPLMPNTIAVQDNTRVGNSSDNSAINYGLLPTMLGEIPSKSKLFKIGQKVITPGELFYEYGIDGVIAPTIAHVKKNKENIKEENYDTRLRNAKIADVAGIGIPLAVGIGTGNPIAGVATWLGGLGIRKLANEMEQDDVEKAITEAKLKQALKEKFEREIKE